MVDKSTAFAARLPIAAEALQAAPPQAGELCDAGAIHMMDWLQKKAILRESVVEALAKELKALGVESVQEMHGEDWVELTSWPSLKPFEQRRVLKVTGSS